MRVVSIRNYEHLCGTLQELKQQGVQGYVGMCCQHFFIKRHQAFLDAGIPTVLMDVSGSNCYELRQEEQAYAGTFQAQARLDVHLLCSIMECNKPTGQG
jgi:lipoate-protein ligase A